MGHEEIEIGSGSERAQKIHRTVKHEFISLRSAQANVCALVWSSMDAAFRWNEMLLAGVRLGRVRFGLVGQIGTENTLQCKI